MYDPTPESYALKLLGRREYGRLEMRKKLQQRFDEVSEEEIQKTLDTLMEHDWQSDQRYAQAFIRDQIIKRQGPIKIGHKLREKGIESTIINEALCEVYRFEQQLEIAQYLYKKKKGEILNKKPNLTDFELKGKTTQFLLGRGFGYDIINEI